MPKPTILHNLNIPLAQRKRTHTGPYFWTPTPPMSGRGFYMQHDTRDFVCASHGSGFDLRIDLANEHLTGRIANTTSYGSQISDDSFTPIVFRLPRGRGFLAGWTLGAGMASTMEPELYDDAQSAAFAAHSVAERAAEAQQDYDAAFLEGQQLRDRLGDSLQILKDAVNRIRAARNSAMNGVTTAASILSRDAERLMGEAKEMRDQVWRDLNGIYPREAAKEGFHGG